MIKLNIDKVKYKQKPTDNIGIIRNRLCSKDRIFDVDFEIFAALIEEGTSFTPGVLEGTTADTWKEQRLICADIDNKKDDNTMLDAPLLPDQAIEVMAQYGIIPAIMYYTFSNKPDFPKYRIVVMLDQPLNDYEDAAQIREKFINIFNIAAPGCSDRAVKDANRIFYGGPSGCVFYQEKKEISADLLRRLPEVTDRKDPAKATERKDYSKPRQPHPGRQTYQDLQDQLKYDIEHFDLAGYVEGTTGSRPVKRGTKLFFNPCPICGHYNDFQVSGHLYHCWSDSLKGGTGGSCIDYLIHKEDMTQGEALDYFKFQIMKYDREEWNMAWKAQKYNDIDINNMFIDSPEADPDQTQPEPVPGAIQAKDDVTEFLEKVQTEAYKPYKTELSFFDNLLNGGVIRQTLLLLLAAPGTGKTTLCAQIAEQMAYHKKPVLYINLEMSREQMLAKVISGRLARKGKSMTALEILQGYKWTEEQKNLVMDAISDYKENIQPYLSFNPDGVGSDLESIKSYLNKIGERAKAAKREAPVIVLDYLHLISCKGLDIHELIKQAVIMLKQYAIEYNTFVIGIGATNRTSNSSGKITMESGRDSSNLEYTADYQLSLNYYDIDQGKVKPDDVEGRAKLEGAKWRQMIIRVLKGRLGTSGCAAKVYFHAANNIFYGQNDWMPADAERVPFNNSKETPKAGRTRKQ